MNQLEALYREGRYAEGRRLQLAISLARGGTPESGGALRNEEPSPSRQLVLLDQLGVSPSGRLTAPAVRGPAVGRAYVSGLASRLALRPPRQGKPARHSHRGLSG